MNIVKAVRILVIVRTRILVLRVAIRAPIFVRITRRSVGLVIKLESVSSGQVALDGVV